MAGIEFGLQPPPIRAGAPPLLGLAQVALAHEDKVWQRPYGSLTGVRYKQTYEEVLELVDQADARLEGKESEAVRRRQNPLYWADRILRAVLGFPAYLISLVLGFDRRDLPTSAARLLWLVSVAADFATIWGAGRLLGWW